MNDLREDLRQFEDEYNSAVNANPAVTEAIELRNIAWGEAFKRGDVTTAETLLARSARLLAEESGTFSRERYATVARQAQLSCALGQFAEASDFAHRALSQIPQGFDHKVSRRLEDFGPVVSPRRMNAEFDVERPLSYTLQLPDQYEAIFTGRLSLVMATSMSDGDLQVALQLAGRAKSLARRSENPDKMSFTNREMDEDERKGTRRRFMAVARFADFGVYLPMNVPRPLARISPVPLSRRDLAQTLCAK